MSKRNLQDQQIGTLSDTAILESPAVQPKAEEIGAAVMGVAVDEVRRDQAPAHNQSTAFTAEDAKQSVLNKSSVAGVGSYELIGQIVSLLSLSQPHRHLFLADLDWRLSPPIMLGQCRLFRREGRPFAFISWALVAEEIVDRLQTAGTRLRPDEWGSGSQLVFVDVVAPFGGADECMREISKTLRV